MLKVVSESCYCSQALKSSSAYFSSIKGDSKATNHSNSKSKA